ncbi:hypothetical protein SprV_0802555800 [Sparganum proliferum]
MEAQLSEMRSELTATRGTIVRQVKFSCADLTTKVRTDFSTGFLARLVANQEAEMEQVRAAAREKLRNTIAVYERKLVDAFNSGKKDRLTSELAQNEQTIQKLKLELKECKKRIDELENHTNASEDESVEESFKFFADSRYPNSIVAEHVDSEVQVKILNEADFEKLVKLNEQTVVRLITLESERDTLKLELQKTRKELFEKSLQVKDFAIEREIMKAEYQEVIAQRMRTTQENATMTTPVRVEARATNTREVKLAEKATQALIHVETAEELASRKELELYRSTVGKLQNHLEDRDRLIEILRKERSRLDEGNMFKQVRELQEKVAELTAQRSRLNQAAAKRISFLQTRLEHVAQSALDRNREIQNVTKLHTAAVAYLKKSRAT